MNPRRLWLAYLAAMGIPITAGDPPLGKPLLIFDHDAQGTPGYVIEETTNLVDFHVVGYVWASNWVSWNPTNYNPFTYHFYKPKDLPLAFYRAGTLLWPSNAIPSP